MSEQPRDLKHEQNLEEMRNLRHSIDALTSGIGATVQRHEGDIAVLKDNMASIKYILQGIFISSVGILGLSFWKLVLKQ